jgi:hypothetical protein
VEAGSNTSFVALRVVGGDEKGNLESAGPDLHISAPYAKVHNSAPPLKELIYNFQFNVILVYFLNI